MRRKNSGPDSLRIRRGRVVRLARILAVAIGLSVGVGAPSATALLPATGTLTLLFGPLPSLTLSGTGSASSAGGPGSSHTIPAGFFDSATPITVTSNATFLGVADIRLSSAVQGASASFAPGGALAIAGTGTFLSPMDGSGGQFPLSLLGGTTGTSPFAVGVLPGHLLGASFVGAGSGGPIVFARTAVALGIPVTLTATAYDNRTAGGVGTVQLVAPATGDFGIFGSMPVFGVLQIRYTPEPGSLILLGSGLAALGAGVRRRR